LRKERARWGSLADVGSRCPGHLQHGDEDELISSQTGTSRVCWSIIIDPARVLSTVACFSRTLMKRTGIDRLLGEHEKRLKQLESDLPFHPSPAASGQGRLSRAWTWITKHKATSILLSVFLTLASIFGSGYFKNYLDHKDDSTVTIADKETSKNVTPLLNDLDRKVTETQTTLKTLQPFIEDLVRREMDGASALPRAELQKKLPRIRDVVSVARVQRVAVDQRVVARLGNNLFRSRIR
jgi:hypothetical protein